VYCSSPGPVSSRWLASSWHSASVSSVWHLPDVKTYSVVSIRRRMPVRILPDSPIQGDVDVLPSVLSLTPTKPGYLVTTGSHGSNPHADRSAA
jgi:hypothetical protein